MGTLRFTSIEEDPQQLALEHEWYVLALTGPLYADPPAERGWWDAQSAQLVTGWRPGCDCGWRGAVFARDVAQPSDYFSADGSEPPYVEGYAQGAGAEHLNHVLALAYLEARLSTGDEPAGPPDRVTDPHDA